MRVQRFRLGDCGRGKARATCAHSLQNHRKIPQSPDPHAPFQNSAKTCETPCQSFQIDRVFPHPRGSKSSTTYGRGADPAEPTQEGFSEGDSRVGLGAASRNTFSSRDNHCRGFIKHYFSSISRDNHCALRTAEERPGRGSPLESF